LMKSQLSWVLVLLAAVILMSMSAFTFQGNAEERYIEDPGKVNQIIDEDDIDTPKIDPGESDYFQFSLYNPYEDSMEDVDLTLSIYRLEYTDVEKNISEVENPPVFTESGTVNITLQYEGISSGEKESEELNIETASETEEGTYLVKFRLDFEYEDEEHLMKSVGHFTDQELDDAGMDEDPDEEFETGRIDIEQLNVSGLLPDSSFAVRRTLPGWIQYFLGVVSVIFGTLAVIFYLQEKYDMFPRLEKAFDKWSSKFK